MNASEEMSMNSRTKPPLYSVLSSIFKESFSCLPFVFKNISRYFLPLWGPFVLLCFTSYSLTLGEISSEVPFFNDILPISLQFLARCFTTFIVPYYVYAFIQKKEQKEFIKFWDFISENVFPLVINHIKASFVILGYFLLLIIPGIIKGLRFSLVTQSTFFKDTDQSALKDSQKTTKGYLLLVLGLILFSFLLPVILKPFFYSIPYTSSYIWIQIIISSIKYFMEFYLQCFVLILMTQTYFILQKVKRG